MALKRFNRVGWCCGIPTGDKPLQMLRTIDVSGITIDVNGIGDVACLLCR